MICSEIQPESHALMLQSVLTDIATARIALLSITPAATRLTCTLQVSCPGFNAMLNKNPPDSVFLRSFRALSFALCFDVPEPLEELLPDPFRTLPPEAAIFVALDFTWRMIRC